MAASKRNSRKLPRRRRPTPNREAGLDADSDSAAAPSRRDGVLQDLIGIIVEVAEQRSGVNDAAIRACIRALWSFGTTKHDDSQELCRRIEASKRASRWSDEAFRRALAELREVSESFAAGDGAEDPLLNYLRMLRQP